MENKKDLVEPEPCNQNLKSTDEAPKAKKPKKIRDLEKKSRIAQRAERDLNTWLNSSMI